MITGKVVVCCLLEGLSRDLVCSDIRDERGVVGVGTSLGYSSVPEEAL